MARVFVDTSAIYALLDRDDAHHRKARGTLQRLGKQHAEPVLTNFVRAESHALLLNRLGSDVARRWLTENVWPIERVTPDDEIAAVEIVRAQVDKGYSLTDATSFAVMQRLKISVAFAFDRHFAQFGFETA
ncbi:MAG TPA: PIN domain-containing protein [Polyangia bacterium]|jgi:predicted nucleic acid-binding protein|nr:PIN domain-containing protein [Polyangia bacterium]